MNKYGLHGKLTATSENAQKLADILIIASQLISTAKGCLLYMVSLDETDPNSVWVTEAWDSKTDHQNSLQIDGVKELISEAIPLLSEKPELGQELTILGGYGIK